MCFLNMVFKEGSTFLPLYCTAGGLQQYLTFLFRTYPAYDMIIGLYLDRIVTPLVYQTLAPSLEPRA